VSNIIWIIVIGFVAGVIAKFISPGPNEPSGFVITTLLWHGRCVRRDLYRPNYRLVSARPGRGSPRRDRRSVARAVCLEQDNGQPRVSRPS
jgi:hypothetical protein